MKKMFLVIFCCLFIFQGCGKSGSSNGAGPTPEGTHPEIIPRISNFSDLIKLIESDCKDIECIAEAKYLLSNGANIELVGKEGATPLLYAIGFNKFELAKFLIYRGANINVKTSSYYTPLLLVIQQSPNNVELINYLLVRGAKIEPFDDSSTLGYALRKDSSLEVIKTLVAYGADLKRNSDIIVERDSGGYPYKFLLKTNPLMHSIYRQQYETYEYFRNLGLPFQKLTLSYWTDRVITREMSVLDLLLMMKSTRSSGTIDKLISSVIENKFDKVDNTTIYFASGLKTDADIAWINTQLNNDPALSIDFTVESGTSTVQNVAGLFNYKLIYSWIGKTSTTIEAVVDDHTKDNILGEVSSDWINLYYKKKATMCTSSALSIAFPKLLNGSKEALSPLFSSISTALTGTYTAGYLAGDLAEMMIVCGASKKVKNADNKTPIQYAQSMAPNFANSLKATEPDPIKCLEFYSTTFKCLK